MTAKMSNYVRMLNLCLVFFAFTTFASAIPSANTPPPSSLPVQTPWHFSKTPSFCRALISSPRPYSSECNFDPETKLCSDGKPTFFSQMKQDYYLYTNHFSHLTRRGIYMDVAANYPVSISNTYFMDACLGWSGLCVEANPTYLSGLYKYRTCEILPTCVTDRDGKSVTFALHAGLSGVWDTNKSRAALKRQGVSPPLVRQMCTTLEEAAKKHKMKKVDYMSLDVEGHELNVLQGIDWDHIVINVLTIETTADTLPPIQSFMESKGYVRHYPEGEANGKLYEDAVFLHKDVEWGRPK